MNDRFSLKTASTGLRAAIIICALFLPMTAVAGNFVVIVNDSNAYQASSSEASEVVRQLFLKERSKWPDGTDAKPFSPKWGTPMHDAFLSRLLAMDGVDLSRHWVTLKSKTGETAPREFKNDSLVLKVVAGFDGGIGIVESRSAAGASGVKILFQLP